MSIFVCFMTFFFFIEIIWYFPFKHELFLPKFCCCHSRGLSLVQMFSYSDFCWTKRLFWLSINERKETAHSAINKWGSFLLQEDVHLQWEGQHWILSNLFIILLGSNKKKKKKKKKNRNTYICILNITPMQTWHRFQNTHSSNLFA